MHKNKKPTTEYVTNKQLLAEIHKSKITYCHFVDPKFSSYDAIVNDVSKITPTLAQAVLEERQSQRKKDVSELPKSIDDLVFRVMTYEHIPLCDDKKKRSRSVNGEGHLRTNFPPFKHYILVEGKPFEVGRSHWIGDLETGTFSLDHGKINHRLANMFMLLVERYSKRSNWRNYTYLDEMRSSALMQLSQTALLFDESKGDNPFAWYTQVIKNQFTRVFNIERKNQNLRDEMLIMHGATPSFTRQIENEMSFKIQTNELPVQKSSRKKSSVKVDTE